MKKSKLGSIVSTLVLIVLGVILLVHPGDTLNLAVRLVGVALILVGAVGVVTQLVKKEDKSVFSIIVGLIEIVVGIIVLAAPTFVVSLFPIIVGIVVALYGISDLVAAVQLKKAGASNTWALILAAITVLLGIILIFNPFKTLTTLIRVIGIVLIYKSVTGLIIRLKA